MTARIEIDRLDDGRYSARVSGTRLRVMSDLIGATPTEAVNMALEASLLLDALGMEPYEGEVSITLMALNLAPDVLLQANF